MALLAAGLDPDGAGGAELAFPDRNPGLDCLDSGPAGGKRLRPMGSGGRDHHGDIAYQESANSMAENDLRFRVAPGEILRDAGHLLLRHGTVGLVFQPIHPMTLVFAAHDADEEGESAVLTPPQDCQKRAGIERVRRKEVHGNMIRPEAGIER